jgi:dihydroflavonol-4-reductase
MTPTTIPGRALVTGATGLLGGSIVRELLAAGGEVVALVREEERARRLLPAAGRLRIAVGDVTDLDSFRRELKGLDAVFHTAAYFREYYQPQHDLDLLYRTNVEVVDELLHAAADAAVPVVVHTSSIGVLGPGSPDAPADEDTPPGPGVEGNAYRTSKLRSEEVVRRFCRRSDEVRVPVVLPGWMWGPGDFGPTSAGRLFLAVARGELRAVPRAGNHVVDARDVAAACVRAAAVGDSGRRYVVAGSWRSLADVCAGVARAVGAEAPRQVPARLALTVATVLELSARLRRRPAVATRTGVKVLLEGDRARFSSARAVRELGVSFRPLHQTLADEAAWYREQGLLPAAS